MVLLIGGALFFWNRDGARIARLANVCVTGAAITFAIVEVGDMIGAAIREFQDGRVRKAAKKATRKGRAEARAEVRDRLQKAGFDEKTIAMYVPPEDESNPNA